MEFLFELIFELIIEGSMELCKNKNINFLIRIIAFLILLTLYSGFFIILTLIAIQCLKNNLLAGIFIVIFILILLILSINKFIKEYRNRIWKEVTLWNKKKLAN